MQSDGAAVLSSSAAPGSSKERGSSVLPALLVGGLALLLRLPWLDRLGLKGDEDISTLAIRGILQSGIPLLPSGSVYWRSALYHYLASPLAAFGIDWLPRILSVVLSAITAVLVVRIGRRWMGEGPALIGGILFGLSLVEIDLAREIRMYALYQPLALAALWALYRFWKDGDQRWGWLSWILLIVAVHIHALAITLCTLYVLVAIRHPTRKVGTFLALALPSLLASWMLMNRIMRHGMQGGYPIALEPDSDPAGAVGLVHFQGFVLAEHLGYAINLLGPVVFSGLCLVLLAVGGIWGYKQAAGHPSWARVTWSAGIGLALAFAGAHQIGLALVLLVLLLLTSADLLPGPAARAALLRTGAVVAAIGLIWLAIGILLGEGLRHTLIWLIRSPARHFQLFFWPPVIGLAALAGVALILIRSWRGRATDEERFLLFAIVSGTALRAIFDRSPQLRYLADFWPLWDLLAGWAIWQGATRVAELMRTATHRRLAMGLSLGAVAVVTALAPGTGFAHTLRFLQRGPGQTVAGLKVQTNAPDIAGATRWLAAHLEEGDRVVATDWIATYCYLGQVDGWIRWRGYGKQSVVKEGTFRDVYLGAEVLPDLEALQSYARRWPVWVVAGGLELTVLDDKMQPEVRSWLQSLEPAFVGSDGLTRVYSLKSPRS